MSAKVPISSVPVNSQTKEVRLDQSILDAATVGVQDKKDWQIVIGKVVTNYRAGVKISGWIVLHNGDDEERMVTVAYEPADKLLTDSTSQVNYLPTPNTILPEWVSIGEKQVRLSRMETKAVGVSLLIPENKIIKTKHWAFYVNADGQAIREYEQKSKVTTEDNDTVLKLVLSHPLLNGDIKFIKKVNSELNESLKVTNYDTKSRILTIEGFQESSVRNLTLTYEYGSMFTQAFNQIWLLTML